MHSFKSTIKSTSHNVIQRAIKMLYYAINLLNKLAEKIEQASIHWVNY